VRNPYAEMARTPGGLAFSAAGFLARLPISMLGIGVVLLVSRATGSYTGAGVVTACFAVAEALGQPFTARLVDRHGQRRVVTPLVVAHVLALVALVWLAGIPAPVAVLAVPAAVAGASLPNVGSLVRARWSHQLSGRTVLRTAFSFESVIDEVIFVVGPPLVTVLAARYGPAPAVLSTLVFLVVGAAWLLSQRATEPPARGSAPAAGGSALRLPTMRLVMAVMAALGIAFGSIEVITVAGAGAAGHPAQAGVLLALYAGGSLVAGIVYGANHLAVPLRRQLLVLGLATPFSLVALPFAGSTAATAVLIFVAGFVISPTLIAGFSLVQEAVPADRLTEGLTWATTAIGLGVAVGAALGGRAADLVGAPRAYLVPLAAAVLVAAIVGLAAIAGRRRAARPAAG
jgi:predicted MFS family arabinose efflux permease